MIFRQLFDPESSTYTYLLGCAETRQCLLLDPVAELADRDLKLVEELGLRLITWICRTRTRWTFPFLPTSALAKAGRGFEYLQLARGKAEQG